MTRNFTATVAYCPDANSEYWQHRTLDNSDDDVKIDRLNCDLADMKFGYMSVPPLSITYGAESDGFIRTTLFITDKDLFKAFLTSTIANDATEISLDGYVNVQVIYSLFTFEILQRTVKSLPFKHIMTLAGMRQSSAQMYSFGLDFSSKDASGNSAAMFPFLNLTSSIFNPSTTSLEDLGYVRSELYGPSSSYQQTQQRMTSYLGYTFTNAYIRSNQSQISVNSKTGYRTVTYTNGWSNLTSLGPITVDPIQLAQNAELDDTATTQYDPSALQFHPVPYHGVNFLISNYINGRNTTLSAQLVQSKCCVMGMWDCCRPVSTSSFYSFILEGLSFNYTVVATRKTNIVAKAFLEAVPEVGGAVEVAWTIYNPFGVGVQLTELDLQVQYGGIAVATFYEAFQGYDADTDDMLKVLQGVGQVAKKEIQGDLETLRQNHEHLAAQMETVKENLKEWREGGGSAEDIPFEDSIGDGENWAIIHSKLPGTINKNNKNQFSPDIVSNLPNGYGWRIEAWENEILNPGSKVKPGRRRALQEEENEEEADDTVWPADLASLSKYQKKYNKRDARKGKTDKWKPEELQGKAEMNEGVYLENNDNGKHNNDNGEDTEEAEEEENNNDNGSNKDDNDNNNSDKENDNDNNEKRNEDSDKNGKQEDKNGNSNKDQNDNEGNDGNNDNNNNKENNKKKSFQRANKKDKDNKSKNKNANYQANNDNKDQWDNNYDNKLHRYANTTLTFSSQLYTIKYDDWDKQSIVEDFLSCLSRTVEDGDNDKNSKYVDDSSESFSALCIAKIKVAGKVKWNMLGMPTVVSYDPHRVEWYVGDNAANALSNEYSQESSALSKDKYDY
eukprot:gb/GEZN01001404.1/.p1 GENE.gb/GEZN01001404.1/~~gb/GEZN01001404.1/.p1  ORF type:complete len:914 (-),score=183.52 gb/GEZN01001404.1/:333-2858(-)